MNIKDLKELKKKLAALSVAGTLAASQVGFAMTEVYANTDDELDKDNIKKVEEVQESDYSYKSDLTTDKEEVEKWLDEKENNLKDDYEITKKEIIEIENQVTSTEKVEVNEKFDTEEEAKAKKEELEKGDIESSDLSIEKKDAVIENVDRTFNTKEEALNFVKEYKEKYNADLSVSEIYGEWISNGTIEVKELSGLTKEELDKEVEKIKNEIESASTDNIRYEVLVQQTSKTEKVYVKDNVTNETKVFNSLEEANKFIDNLKLSEDENIKVEINGPVLKKVLVGSETSAIEKLFESEEALNAYIEKLKEEGYELNDIATEKVIEKHTEKVPTGDVTIKDSNKLDSNSKYEVKGNYIMLKQASGNIAIWTKEEMTKEEQESFKENWFKGNYDSAIGKDVNVHFIFGEGEKDLSYIGNGWGSYNITVKNDKIVMTCDAKRISHINYGSYEPEYAEKEVEETKYKVTGNKTMNKYEDKYQVDYKKIEKIFEEVTTYGAVISKEEFIRDYLYNVNGSYEKEGESWILSGEYIKNNRGSLFYGLIAAKEKDKEINDEEEKDKDKEKDEEELNASAPQTGDDNNLLLYLGTAGASLAAAGFVAGKRRKRTRE